MLVEAAVIGIPDPNKGSALVRHPRAHRGGNYTLDRERMKFGNGDEPFASRHASSLRAIYDFSDQDASQYIHAGSQSGNRLSPHYESFSECGRNASTSA